MWKYLSGGQVILELTIMPSKYVVTCKSYHEWKPNVVNKHFMVSATYVPSQDVVEQQTTETANYSGLMELNNFSVRLSLIARHLCCCGWTLETLQWKLIGIFLGHRVGGRI